MNASPRVAARAYGAHHETHPDDICRDGGACGRQPEPHHHAYGPAPLSKGANGTLIGVIEGDFDFYAGSAFQLAPPASGTNWTVTQLWDFNRGPDRNPLNVVTGRGGNLFGVVNGGDSTGGSLFELTHP